MPSANAQPRWILGDETVTLGGEDVTALVLGCAVLGVGGGGNAETGGWAARHVLATNGPVPLVTLNELKDDDLVVPLGAIGAPTISQEMLPSGDEPRMILDEVERLMGRTVSAIMPSEIGGSNGVRSLGWAASLGLPLLDADGMGRAFPEINMISMDLAGIPVGNAVMADVTGNLTTIRAVDAKWAERMARASCVASGSSAILACYIMTAAQARGAVIEGSISRALDVGRVLLDKGAGIDKLCQYVNGTRLLDGKIIELERHDSGGFVRGSVVFAGVGSDKNRYVRMEIQNENLILLENGECLASVPDLIVALDSESGRALGTDSLQFGQRVTVIAWPCDPIWRTPKGLERTGPSAFGYDINYESIESRSRGRREHTSK